MTLSIDPDAPTYVFATGRKGSGKSTILRELRAWWPYDALIIDVNGDDETSPDVRQIEGGMPGSWKELRTMTDTPEAQPFVHARWQPDPTDPGWREQTDQLLGLAISRDRPILVQIHEIGTLAKPNQVQPHLEAILHQGRHYRISLHCAGPRPINVDPLVLAQADHVAVFDLPAPQDRKRVADAVGWDPAEHDGVGFDELVRSLEVHEFLWIDCKQREVTHCVPGK